MDFTKFYNEQFELIKKLELNFKRSVYELLDIKNNKLIALLGQRGVGKSTMLLQKLKELNNNNALYISVDNPYFANVNLYEFAKKFEHYGGEFLFIDEIHKYRDIGSHLKVIYDMTNLKVIVSGSSLLQIYKEADLSRRIYEIRVPVMSFREFLEVKGYFFNKYPLEEIITNHIDIAKEIASKIRPLKYFKEYLEYGCYPFFLEGLNSYKQKLLNILNYILEVDLPYTSNISYSNIDKLKRLLYLISISVPFTPNINELSQKTQISRPSLLEYLYLLEKSEILINLHFKSRGISKLQKPDKIYLNNTNLVRAIAENSNIGNERETFFVNQIKSYFLNKKSFFDEDIILSKQGDFIVKDFVFEIGGKNKTKKQIKEIQNAFVIKDDIEIGDNASIPLWIFGFLY
ncbi:ATP-binding protein [Nitrosophilus labii]|uniref:ATP-binding protein n=1 Tax=Nitrosophilus labii TaxID=2706014 RepID=UPI001656A718|nr:AAA family ATPase [Nitrosophilus labii]